MGMSSENELLQDIQLNYWNVHGKNCRIHNRTYYLAKKRVVVYHSTCTKLRFFKFLPPKEMETKAYLKIPESITTEEELIRYVKKKESHWLRGR